jgi:hypothetical protein
VVYIHNGALFSYEEEQNHVIFRKMNETGDHASKQDKLTWRDKYHAFSHMWNVAEKKKT